MFSYSALGQPCAYTNECAASDPNSECDTVNTDTCICTDNYVEEFGVCKSEYIDPGFSNFLQYTVNSEIFARIYFREFREIKPSQNGEITVAY